MALVSSFTGVVVLIHEQVEIAWSDKWTASWIYTTLPGKIVLRTGLARQEILPKFKLWI